MRIFVLSSLACLAAVAALSGCATDPKAALVGSYQADPASLKLPAAMAALASKAKESIGKTTLKLNSDDTFVLGGGPQSLTGKWKFDDKTVTLTPPTGDPMSLTIGAGKKSLEISRDLPGGKMSLTLAKTG